VCACVRACPCAYMRVRVWMCMFVRVCTDLCACANAYAKERVYFVQRPVLIIVVVSGIPALYLCVCLCDF